MNNNNNNNNNNVKVNDIVINKDKLKEKIKKRVIEKNNEKKYLKKKTNSRAIDVTITCDGGTWQEEISWIITDATGVEIVSGDAPYTSTVSLEEDTTYTLTANDSYGDGWNDNYLSVVNDEGITYFNYTLEAGSEDTTTFMINSNKVYGCTDPDASNYDSNATVDNMNCVYPGSSCENAFTEDIVNNGPVNGAIIIGGEKWHVFDIPDVYKLSVSLCESDFDTVLEIWDACDASTYIAYNDDFCDIQSQIDLNNVTAGTYYAKIRGFNNATSGNYVLTITTADEQINGCTDNIATNYDPLANTDDGSCTYINGCTDSDANNYDPSATKDDGSCTYSSCTTDISLNMHMVDSYGDGWNGNSYSITAYDDSIPLYTGTLEDGTSGISNPICLDNGAYNISCDGGSFQNEVSWELKTSDDSVIISGGAPFNSVFTIGQDIITGCTDSNAINYDSNATVDDMNCKYTGDICENAFTKAIVNNGSVNGEIIAGDEKWYVFDLLDDVDNLSVSLCGSDFDTILEIWDACDASNYIAYNDDFCGSPNLQSQIDLAYVTAGTYYAKIRGWSSSSFGNYILTITSSMNITEPVLTATGMQGMNLLTWESVPTPDDRHNRHINRDNKQIKTIKDIKYNKKKKNKRKNPHRKNKHPSKINSSYILGNRATDVTITCDGGKWQDEISWIITDAMGAEIVSGVAPETLKNVSLDEDTNYTLIANDSFGDGWNGNFLSVVNYEGITYLNYTLENGAGPDSTTFMINSNEVYGCMNQIALNYDSTATIDGMNCEYTPPDNDLCDSAMIVNNEDIIQGNNYGSTVDSCSPYDADDNFNLMWYAITLPYNSNNVVITIQLPDSIQFNNTGLLMLSECCKDGSGITLYANDYTYDPDNGYIQLSFYDVLPNSNNKVLFPMHINPIGYFTVTFQVTEVYIPQFNIYRNGVSLVTKVKGNSYSDSDVDNGTEYCYTCEQIRLDDTTTDMSNEACATPITPIVCEDDMFEEDDTKDSATDHLMNGTFKYKLCTDDNLGGTPQIENEYTAIDWSIVAMKPLSKLTVTTTVTTTGKGGDDIDLFIEDIDGDGICQWGFGDDLAGSGSPGAEETAVYNNLTNTNMNVYIGVIYGAGSEVINDPINYNLTITQEPISCPDCPQNVNVTSNFNYLSIEWEEPLVAPGQINNKKKKPKTKAIKKPNLLKNARGTCANLLTIEGSDGDNPCYTDGTGYYVFSWTGGCLATNLNYSGGDIDITASNFTEGFLLFNFAPGAEETFILTFADGTISDSITVTNDCPPPVTCEDNGLVTCPDGTCVDNINECLIPNVQVNIVPDFYPGETSYEIVNNDTSVVVASGNSDGGSHNLELGKYTFTIFDSFGDGICCAVGEGSYSVTVDGEVVINCSGECASFGSQKSDTFIVGTCEDQSLVTCSDGSCTDTIVNCPVSCEDQGLVTCSDGSCVDTIENCPSCVESLTIEGSDGDNPCYTDGTGYYVFSWTGGCLATSINYSAGDIDMTEYNFTNTIVFFGFAPGAEETFILTFADGTSSEPIKVTNDCPPPVTCEDQGLVTCSDGSCAENSDDCPIIGTGDTIEDPIIIPSNIQFPYTIIGSTVGYSNQYDEACPYAGSTSPDVVYSYTPTKDMSISINTCGEATNYDTKLYVYENNSNTLATLADGTLACNDDECANSTQSFLSSISEVVLTADNTYYIIVDGYNGASGDYELTIDCITGCNTQTCEDQNLVKCKDGSCADTIENCPIGDDIYEDNDSILTPSPIGVGDYNLMLLNNDPDYYSINVNHNQTLKVTFTDSESTDVMDFGIYCLAIDTQGPLCGKVNISNFECEYTNTTGSKQEFIIGVGELFGDLNVQGAYMLSIELIEIVPILYNIYRDGTMIAENIDGLQYIDDNSDLVNDNDYCYSVQATYNAAVGQQTDPVCGSLNNNIPSPYNVTAGGYNGMDESGNTTFGVIWEWDHDGVEHDHDENVQVNIVPDAYPEETSYEIVNNDTFVVVASGNSNGGSHNLESGKYTFTIFDSFGDGICCAVGEGSYSVIVDGEVVINCSGECASFGSQKSDTFTVSASRKSAKKIKKFINLKDGLLVNKNRQPRDDVTYELCFDYNEETYCFPTEDKSIGITGFSYDTYVCATVTAYFSNYLSEPSDKACANAGKFGIYGCTDPNACNYNPEAEYDNGTCAEFDCAGVCNGNTICGCMESDACNYNSYATYDDGNCNCILYINSGWRLISITQENYNTIDYDNSVGIVENTLYGFNGSIYEEVTQLELNKGYWILAETDNAIVVLQPREKVILKSENFDSYNNGDSIADVSNDFVTWSSGSLESEYAYVSNEQSNSAPNSLKINEDNDVLYLKDGYTTGKYEIKFNIFIPSGYAGYFNIQKTENPGKEWALEIFFESDGLITATNGESSGLIDINHTYMHDMWNEIKLTIDLDNNTCMYTFNSNYSTSFEYNNVNDIYAGIGSINFYGPINSLYYIDDIEFKQI